jgi:hypothetical protein
MPRTRPILPGEGVLIPDVPETQDITSQDQDRAQPAIRAPPIAHAQLIWQLVLWQELTEFAALAELVAIRGVGETSAQQRPVAQAELVAISAVDETYLQLRPDDVPIVQQVVVNAGAPRGPPKPQGCQTEH